VSSDLLIIALVLLPPFDWAVALILGWLTVRYPDILTLKERAITAWIIAIVSTVAALLAWARLGNVTIANDAAILLLAIALILVSVPSVFWLMLLLTGRFRLPPEGEA
jgi:hypothetical protein